MSTQTKGCFLPILLPLYYCPSSLKSDKANVTQDNIYMMAIKYVYISSLIKMVRGNELEVFRGVSWLWEFRVV